MSDGGTKNPSNKPAKKRSTKSAHQSFDHGPHMLLSPGHQTRSGNSVHHVEATKKTTKRKKKQASLCDCIDLLHCIHQTPYTAKSSSLKQHIQDGSALTTNMKPLKSCLSQKKMPPKAIWGYTPQSFPGMLFLFFVGVIFGLTTLSWRWFHSTPPIPMELTDLDSSPESLEMIIKWTQSQLELVDSKLKREVANLKTTLEDKIAAEAMNVGAQLHDIMTKVDHTSSSIEEFMHRGGSLTKKEIYNLVKAAASKHAEESAGNTDELRALARKIIKSELEVHGVEGLARADFAVESGGGHVVDHSEGYFLRRGQWSFSIRNIFPGSSNLHPFAPKILQHSLGEPGQCLPLKGSNVFVDIALRTAILVDAITLEHVARSVAFDLSSAPKDFRVLGWHEPDFSNKHVLSKKRSTKTPYRFLGEFTYKLEGPTIQTFDLLFEESSKEFINMVRLHVLSNYGSPTHTCIYRVRVHGTDPWMPSAPRKTM